MIRTLLLSRLFVHLVTVTTILLSSAATFGQLPSSPEPTEKLVDHPVGPDDTKPAQPEDIRQEDPRFLVRIDVDRASRSYRENDYLSVQVASEADAYIYVLYKQADGKVYQIFPNSVQTDNHVKARQTVQIPTSSDMFRWEIGPPFGKELVKVIASKKPLEALSDQVLREKFFNPVAPKQIKGLRLELGKEKQSAWTEDTVEIATYARDEKTVLPGTKRFAVLFGISEYEVTTATDGKIGMKSPPCHRDAQKLAAVLREVGQFNDLRIYTNDQATRHNFEEAITGWLPSVARPGDTVLVYFSGVALALPSGSGQDPTAVLMPYDYLPPQHLEALLKHGESKGLPKVFAEHVIAARDLVKRAGSLERAAPTIARMSGVDNDLFAHWLQALAGRQIVLIFDTAYAGAFGPQQGKSSTPQGSPLESFSNQVPRLKGLGQREIAMLGASGPRDIALLNDAEDLSVLTHCLINILTLSQSAVTLEQAHEVSSKVMEDIVAKINQQQKADGKGPLPPLKPYFINACSRPVVLKP